MRHAPSAVCPTRPHPGLALLSEGVGKSGYKLLPTIAQVASARKELSAKSRSASGRGASSESAVEETNTAQRNGLSV